MLSTLALTVPQLSDLGPTWLFTYRDHHCRLASTESAFRLWVNDSEVEPTRVLNDEEMEEWLDLREPYVLQYALLAQGVRPHRLLSLHVERMIRRYIDVLAGVAPPGRNNH